MGRLNLSSEWTQFTNQGLMINQIKFFHYHKVNQINIRRLLLTTHHNNQCVTSARERLEHIEDCNNINDHTRKIKSLNQTLKSISVNTDACDNIWNENITLIESKIGSVYSEIVYWKKVLFLLTTGAAGKGLIEETIRLVNSWTYKLDLETIALKALMITPCLLLQKTFFNSKSKENSETLKRRL